MTLEKFKKAWYSAHVSHDPDYARDRKRWRGSVLTAKTWTQVIDRCSGKWQDAALNQCLPWQL